MCCCLVWVSLDALDLCLLWYLTTLLFSLVLAVLIGVIGVWCMVKCGFVVSPSGLVWGFRVGLWFRLDWLAGWLVCGCCVWSLGTFDGLPVAMACGLRGFGVIQFICDAGFRGLVVLFSVVVVYLVVWLSSWFRVWILSIWWFGDLGSIWVWIGILAAGPCGFGFCDLPWNGVLMWVGVI